MSIQPCNNDNCCNMIHADILLLTTPTLSILTKTVVHELYKTLSHLPTSFIRLGTDVWSHLKHEPKKPSWNIQTTIGMGFLQAFRDQSLSNSLEFWRLILIGPTYIKPLHAKIESETIQLVPRHLCGILSPLEKRTEQQVIKIEAEWLSAVSTWERIYGRPTTNHAHEKIVFYLHGGAYCSMSAQTHRILTYNISKSTKRSIFAVNYRLAPETKFPGALYDAVQSYLHLIENHGFQPQNIIVMGDSAGGGLCMAMMLYIRDHGLPKPEGAVLLSPWVDLSFSYPSWKDASMFDYLPSNPSERLQSLNPAHLYLEHSDLITHPYVSPIFADNFDDLPPILIQSGGCESLRDEIEDLTKKLRSSTSFVRHEIYEDMVHVFQMFPFTKSSDAIKKIGWWTTYGISFISK